MTIPTQANTTIATELRETFEGEFLNAFKSGRGRMLSKPVTLDTNDGAWQIVKISEASWIGPAVLVAKIEVIPPIEKLLGIKTARLELDLRDKRRFAELSIIRLR